jgi:hypothetical protein
MTPAELDLVMGGAFIFRRADGTKFATLSRKLAEYGGELIGRAGALTEADLQTPATEYLARINGELAIAAGFRRAKTPYRPEQSA